MYRPSAEHSEALQQAVQGDASITFAHDGKSAKELIRDATAVMGNRFFLQSLPYAKHLRWMQSNSVGVDVILQAREQLRGITLTRAKGVYDAEMADHALALILALTRQLHWIRDEQLDRKWLRRTLPYMSGVKAMILGWGGVGQGIARRLRSFDVRVCAVRRSHVGDPCPDEEGFIIIGPDRWREQLPETGLLIMALPFTQETDGLVGAPELSKLPPHALVVNVGRGETLDQDALLSCLRCKALRGAALDVLDLEPPPPEDPVWDEPRLIITPHVARSKEEPPFRWEPLFVENLRRYVSGEPLLNVVDLDKGY
jgi:phosphoglycerate dehydrogenase-like enzyme